jgi:hypothetical protein
MNELDEIKSIAKNAYRTSIVNNYKEIEDDLWSIILFLDRLENNIAKNTKPTLSRVNINDTKYKDMAYIAYVLSECGHKVFDAQKTQLDVIENLANILDTKPLTLRNIRDSLDTYTNSTREGWKKPLNDRLQFVFDECKMLSCEEVTNNAKSILVKYQ